jgi:mono/diheme cytochrome c family protein
LALSRLLGYLCEKNNSKNMDHGNKWKGRILPAIFFVAAFWGLMSCEDFKITQPVVDPSATWSLQTDIQPIFNNNCVPCHGSGKSPDLREGKSFQSLTSGGYVTLPAETSRLYSTMNGSDHYPRSTASEKLKVLYWITQGALNN